MLEKFTGVKFQCPLIHAFFLKNPVTLKCRNVEIISIHIYGSYNLFIQVQLFLHININSICDMGGMETKFILSNSKYRKLCKNVWLISII